MLSLLWTGIVIALLARHPLSAQGISPSSLGGIVIDVTGAVVPDAVVHLKSPNGDVMRTDSGPDGTFRFTNLSSGRFDIEVEHAGFGRYTSTVRLGRSPVMLTVQLSLSVLEQKVDVREAELEARPDVTSN